MQETADAREASMGIGDLLREKQTVARDSFRRIVVWLRELSRHPQARKGREGHRNLVRFQVRARQAPPCGTSG